ncbi:MAG: ATP-dependent Clp protease adaptor ClpS [Flavobacteriales bacterium]|jgi:ATP-dependent Clp protease adaptor protein ClpS|nr:ATP-dependent Clp protease adaptor ClpS [Flavobacteriales bacterium]MBT4737895.1 ATP-dependent Clp protease adaptor ClpS [Flavobacteriales bacterium]MBT6815883.1 ATP-dependent Clp protease adaptor ClpS [Flavobacteriales bacterium]MBT7620227.1 ATP-dependent Clp protease adaptor ClpS [Flavobacteriales bacterium]
MEYTPEFSSNKNKTNIKTKSLILLNDNFNDFDYVIDCLVLVCNLTPLQSEQLAYIAHYKGRSIIKSGSFLDMINFKKDLTIYGLELEIE